MNATPLPSLSDMLALGPHSCWLTQPDEAGIPLGFGHNFGTWRNTKTGYFTASMDQAVDLTGSNIQQPHTEGGAKTS